MNNMKIAYVVSNLKRVGPTNQTLNIIKNSEFKESSIVITLYPETKDTMIDEYVKENIKIIQLNMNNLKYITIGKKNLKKILVKNNINIVHSYGVKPDYLTQNAVKNTEIKHLITLRNYPKEDILTRMNKISGKIALYMHLKTIKNSENLICCSKTIYEKIKKDYPLLNVSYIQNGVDIDKFKQLKDEKKIEMIRKKIKINKKDIVFISTNSFISRKRIEETIELFLLIPENNKILILLGKGELFEKIKGKYSNINNIIFKGKVNNVIEYLQIADYYISSSESEGLPNSVIEAIACGLPEILSDIPQHEEILNILKNTGYTYKLGDIKDGVSKYVKYNTDKYRKMVNDTEKIRTSRLTMKEMSRRYCEYYKKVVNKK